ncbi:GufA family transport protein (probable substrate zinc) [Natronomonas moolapensis 8.8.11]|uniref:GufA family transport protein (Probable substrate zinc) n=1 Tax=Natronomonas moolapensis (strain DSM 18674 / CECT 7526 / JCM 14361 / 8.8.11) TaxID=268739 RepID=M1XTP8_NATM8|nr:ZIP family metal transporter [Natronomonas moolapensis]CCQ37864.1 GufA family transport protein (probable substrate zinc) [Natronomonas moolapensis 8.8.11]
MENIVFVFVAGLITALATGLGAIPFFFVEDFSDRWNVALWGIASGIMVSASLFGLINEGLAYATAGLPTLLIGGLLVGVALVEAADRVLDSVDIGGVDDPTREGEEAPLGAAAFAQADLKKLVLILGILTVHSFPEGVAVGVSFAELGLEGGLPILGVSVPLLAVFMTVAISIHNVPEGTAIAIPMRAMGLSKWRMVGAAVFSSLPQPIGAAIAFVFVTWAREFLPFGFGFAAGAMVYLVVTEFIPEALDTGADLPGGGRRELLAGLLAGVAAMVPLLYV